jgi:cyclopropane-fatty-acyl-phospholipid synthase
MGIAESIDTLAGRDLPFRLEAYDGSAVGSEGLALTVRVLRRDALVRAITRPGELGLARAYVAGDVEVDGPIYDLFSVNRAPVAAGPRAGALFSLVAHAGPGLLSPPAPPAIEARPRGRLHSRDRDAASVTYHYDVSNEFYGLVLGPTMTYSCAVFEHPADSLEDAQLRKVDLICRKLGLEPGMKLLDVGCGWGTLAIHAAIAYGCAVLGVTLSEPQRELAERRAREAGVSHLVTFRVQDYRDVADGPFDAVSSVGMSEHVGRRALEAYAGRLFGLLRPGGRFLNHAIGRPAVLDGARPANRARALWRDLGAHAGLAGPSRIGSSFIRRYVFPDGELHEVGSLVTAIQSRGFEVRHLESLREHYALTLRHWVGNLESHWRDAERLVGGPRARVWRLYMAGSASGFESGRLEIHQVLAVRRDRGRSHFSLRPRFDRPRGVDDVAAALGR